MVATIVAGLVALLCVGAAWRQLRRVAVDLAQVRAVVAQLRSGAAPADDLLARSGPAGDLVASVLAANGREQAVAEINEHMAGVGRAPDLGDAVPRAAARIALATGACCALVELARSVAAGASSSWPAFAFGAGVTGAVASGALGRAARQGSERRREAHNGLAQELVAMGSPGWADGPSAQPPGAHAVAARRR